MKNFIYVSLILACILLATATGRKHKKDGLKSTEEQQVLHNSTQSNSQSNETKKTDIEKPQHFAPFYGVTVWTQSQQRYRTGEKVIFEGILLNEGVAFDKIFNWFTCQVNGTYFVSLNVRSYGVSTVYLEVVKEDRTIMMVNNDNTDNSLNTDSNSALFYCNTGERIWVQSWNTSSYVYGFPDVPFTTFTVMQMQSGGSVQYHNNSIIGFSAWKEEEQDYTTADRIEFNEVLLNEGGYYDSQLSKFDCPVDGIYYVTVNYRKTETQLLNLGVARNTISILHSTNSVGLNDYMSVSNSRLFECTAGDRVTVIGTGDGEVSGGEDEPVTTFSVMLMIQQPTQAKHLSFIGFTAWKRDSQTYSLLDVIQFDGILFNQGGHYSPITSRFTCPVFGVYYVSLTAKRVFTTPLHIDVRRGTYVAVRLQDIHEGNNGNTITNSALVRCFPDEEIMVQAREEGAVEGDISLAYTTFTVFLMYEYPYE